MKNQLIQCVWAVFLTAAPVRSLWSQSTLYFDRGSFISGAQTVSGFQQSITDFGPYTDPSGPGYGPTCTVADVTFSGRYLAITAIDSGLALWNFDSAIPLGIQFASGARAFGADFSDAYNGVTSFTAIVSLDSGEVLSFTSATEPNSTFFGFISPIPIRSLTFSDGGLFPPNPNIGHQELIGNLYIVTVPEPHTLGFFVLGALLLGWRWRKSSSGK